MQMIKLCTSDEMEVASEMCLGAALTYPVPCLLEITRQLVECVFYDVTHSASATSLARADSSFISTASVSDSQHQAAASYHHTLFVNISINKVSGTVLAKMLVRSLTLLLWAEEKRKENERSKAERR